MFVKLEDTIKGFKGIVAGEYDDLPEAAFYMVGTIEEAVDQGQEAGGRGGLSRWPRSPSELVMPERELLATEADMVVVPGTEGDFGVLPGHAPLISTVRPGVLEVYQGDKVEQRFFVAGGFAEVTPERCTVLADEADAVRRGDARAARRARARGRARRSPTPRPTPRRPPPRRHLAVARDLRRAQAYYASR